MSLCHCNP
jgi:hypothetical protein